MRRNNAVTLLIVVCAIGAILQLMRFALPGSSLGTAAAEHVLLLVAAWIKLDPLTHAMYIVAYGSLAGGAAIHYRILAV